MNHRYVKKWMSKFNQSPPGTLSNETTETNQEYLSRFVTKAIQHRMDKVYFQQIFTVSSLVNSIRWAEAIRKAEKAYLSDMSRLKKHSSPNTLKIFLRAYYWYDAWSRGKMLHHIEPEAWQPLKRCWGVIGTKHSWVSGHIRDYDPEVVLYFKAICYKQIGIHFRRLDPEDFKCIVQSVDNWAQWAEFYIEQNRRKRNA